MELLDEEELSFCPEPAKIYVSSFESTVIGDVQCSRRHVDMMNSYYALCNYIRTKSFGAYVLTSFAEQIRHKISFHNKTSSYLPALATCDLSAPLAI